MLFKLAFALILALSTCHSLSKNANRTVTKSAKTPFEYVKSFCSIRPDTDFCSEQNLRYMFWTQPSEYKRLMRHLKIATYEQMLQETKESLNNIIAQKNNKSNLTGSEMNKQNGKKLVKNMINEFVRLFNA
jgi:hypothetical protein